ncbi:MAG: M10 family metallopeptidase C-terminal domain-containing protein [Hyphomicrobiaceae bacterium]|nr:M10 family metallopeptidase C-terminal domain-containing protein [Hyphomicrobiaceae bacterium]MCC0023730.1 M10 family metallopeptidase C-terminal domain-containing protein [Hyphomicrobiaceae bacterium]
MTTITETTDALTTATAYTIGVGDTFVGHAEDASGPYPNGIDWVKISLEAGVKYRILYYHVPNSGDDYYSDLELYDSGATKVTPYQWTDYVYDGKTYDKWFFYTPATNETFYIGVENDAFTHQFDYELNVAVVPPPSPPKPTNWSDNKFVNQLVHGYWEDYRSAAARKFDTSVDKIITVNIDGLTAAGQEMARAVMALWAGVSGLRFRENSSAGADIIMDDESSGADTEFDLDTNNDTFIDQARINIHKNQLNGSNYVETYVFQTFLHEFGHALGLGHLGNYNGTITYDVNGNGNNFARNDSWQKSVMSYFNQNENTTVDATLGYVITPMLIDILAIQKTYSGLPVSYKAGNTIYNLNGLNTPRKDFGVPSTHVQPYAMTLFDTGGIDTFDASSATNRQFAKLAAGAIWNIDGGTGNVIVGPDTIIENFKGGSKVDVVTGNGRENVIRGNDGNDILSGRGGSDTLFGGDDNDILKGDQGNDTLKGEDGIDRLEGGADNDKLWGGPKKDTLIPGTGNDRMWGEGGDDIFVIGKHEDLNLIYDFQDGKDRINLSDFGYNNKAAAVAHFVELGKKNDDKVKFVDKGTIIKIKGIDLKDVTNDDLII